MGAVSTPARTPEERGPAALLPAPVARLVGFVALGCLGVAQWQRMLADVGLLRPVVWVLLAAATGAALVACDRLAGRRRAVAIVAVAFLGLLVAYVAAGLPLTLLKPRRWDELGSGLVSGSQALSTAQLPYVGADPWPGRVLELLGAELVMLAALLAFWPRPAGMGGRGYPFLALAALLVVAASPVVSLGGTKPLLLGIGLTLLTVCFLWLERLPLRPGIGVAALVALALAGAVPLAAAADRGEPWFDYQAFAEGFSPKDPISFDWEHGDYGPMTWTRTGAEVIRVKADRPAYWKVRTLADFDGTHWDVARFDGPTDPSLDLPVGWETQKRNQDEIQVSVQRMRGDDVVGAGTTQAIRNSTRRIVPSTGPGQWESIGDLQSGDSYRAEVFVPRPTADQLAAIEPSATTEHADSLTVTVNLRQMTEAQIGKLPVDVPVSPLDGTPARSADVQFPPFGRVGVAPQATYPQYGQEGTGENALKYSDLSRTWALAKRLKADSATPYDYVLAVSQYLRNGFTYTEKPPAPKAGVSPLESFLFDTKAGYCQHYSAAMALLLRMGGIPARVATGFSPGGYSKRKQAWIVRDTDAHSWVEAWFDRYGWVTMDPTPAATPARSQIAAIAAPTSDAGGSSATAGQSGPTDPTDRRAAGERERRFGNQVSRGTDEELDGSGGGGGGLSLWPLVPLVLLAGGAAVWATRFRRRRPSGPLERAIWELETALHRTGRTTPTGTTLRQLEQRLGLSGEAAEYVRAIRSSRYAAEPVPPTNAQRRAMRQELASGQGLLGRLRTFWALPPRPGRPTRGHLGRGVEYVDIHVDRD
jgi:transglutaminase-like putative cysteine protease